MTPPSSARSRLQHSRRIYLRIERLDDRALPSASLSGAVYPTVMAGYLKGSPSDSPDNRIDPNTVESPFGGVGSIVVQTPQKTFVGTGTVIGPRHVLTAAHVIDLNSDGRVNKFDAMRGVYFVLNFGEDESHRLAVSQFDIHPDFTGFNRPAVNDDLAILTLAEDIPLGVPIYPLTSVDLVPDTVVTMVGYGRSGNGVTGYTTLASPTIKRVGQNTIDDFYGQDDKLKAPANEIFRFDFDGPKGSGRLGGPTLGNDIETTLGQGDSGGPSFVLTPEGQYTIVGVNTFVHGIAPKFGSMGGGVNVFHYLDFIYSVINVDSVDSSTEDPGQALPSIRTKPSILDTSTGSEPSIEAPAPVTKPGIRIGARPVSGEFVATIDAETTLATRNAEFARANDNTKEPKSNDLNSPQPMNRPDETLTDLASMVTGSPMSIELMSLDAGLVEAATGEALSLEA